MCFGFSLSLSTTMLCMVFERAGKLDGATLGERGVEVGAKRGEAAILHPPSRSSARSTVCRA